MERSAGVSNRLCRWLCDGIDDADAWCKAGVTSSDGTVLRDGIGRAPTPVNGKIAYNGHNVLVSRANPSPTPKRREHRTEEVTTIRKPTSVVWRDGRGLEGLHEARDAGVVRVDHFLDLALVSRGEGP
jgi:hypothetical protein